MFLVFLLSLFIAILLESTLISLPLVFILLLCYSVLNRGGRVFASAFVAGLILDVLTLRTLGVTSLYFILFFTFVLLYQSKYEIRSYPFVVISSLTGSYFYLIFLQESVTVLQGFSSAAIAVFIFAIGKKLKLRVEK